MSQTSQSSREKGPSTETGGEKKKCIEAEQLKRITPLVDKPTHWHAKRKINALYERSMSAMSVVIARKKEGEDDGS